MGWKTVSEEIASTAETVKTQVVELVKVPVANSAQ